MQTDLELEVNLRERFSLRVQTDNSDTEKINKTRTLYKKAKKNPMKPNEKHTTISPMLDRATRRWLQRTADGKRFRAYSKLWLGVILSLSCLMLFSIAFYWTNTWYTWRSYPFSGVDPTVLAALPLRETKSAYITSALVFDGMASACLLAMCTAGIVSSIVQGYAREQWKVVLAAYCSYICAVSGKAAVLAVKYLEMRKDCESVHVVFRTVTPYIQTANVVFMMSLVWIVVVAVLCGGFVLCSYEFKAYRDSTSRQSQYVGLEKSARPPMLARMAADWEREEAERRRHDQSPVEMREFRLDLERIEEEKKGEDEEE